MSTTTAHDPGADRTLLEMRGIGKSFGGTRALDGVDLTVHAGEVVALLGENGAGKSTLINVLSGVFTAYEGEVAVAGDAVTLHSPAEAQRLGVATIHQELGLVPDMSVADNIWLGREHTHGGVVDRRRTLDAATEVLARVGLTFPPTRLVRECRVAEQQLVEVAKALSLDARVLVMDEPTSALADAEVRRLFEVIRSLTEQGVGIVYVSHRLEELEEIADTVTVLRDGRWIGTRAMQGTSRRELITMMVGRAVEDVARRTGATDDAEPRLRIRDLSVRPDPRSGRVGVHHLDLDVRPGEVVGLAGLMGAGRTETLEAVFGAYPASAVSGSTWLDGRPLDASSPKRAIRRGVVLVAEDRKLQSLVLDASVRFNTSLAALGRYVRGGWLRSARERSEVQGEVRRLGVKTASIAAPVSSLSGGNQQKVVLAKWLLTDPRLVLLDEPTRGIDVGAKAEIYELVAGLAADGAAVLVASSELPELLRVCDRIAVLCEGRLTAVLDAQHTDQEAILSAAMSRGSLVAS